MVQINWMIVTWQGRNDGQTNFDCKKVEIEWMWTRTPTLI